MFFCLFCFVQAQPSKLLSYYKLIFSSASIQLTTNDQNQITKRFFFFKNPFHSDVCCNLEEKICRYFCFIAALTQCRLHYLKEYKDPLVDSAKSPYVSLHCLLY